MVNYEREIESDAQSFVSDFEDNIKEAILEGKEFNDCDNIVDSVREHEFYYDLSDAAFVLDNSKEVEEDSGLWEKLEPRQAVISQAVYTSQNDLRIAVEEIYNELKESFEQDTQEIEDKEKDKELLKCTLNTIFKEYFERFELDACEKGSEEEKRFLKEWLSANSKAEGFRGGYPLGSAYIDARCGTGYDGRLDYINIDRETAKRVPHLAGLYRGDIETYFEKTFSEKKIINLITREQFLQNTDEEELFAVISSFLERYKELHKDAVFLDSELNKITKAILKDFKATEGVN